MTHKKGAELFNIWTFTILWFLFCIGITIDTGLFVYLSLSQTLVGGVFLIFLAVCAILQIHKKNVCLSITPIQYIIIAWMGNLLLHSYFVHEAENYKLLYFEETLSLFLILPILLNSKELSRNTIENGILLMDAIQLCGLILQSVGVLESYNSLFLVTGFSENPNVTAILLAICLPILYKRMKKSSRKAPWIIFILFSILFIILLKCRTAYIFLVVVIAVRIVLSYTFKQYWSKTRSFGKSSVIFISIFVVSIFGLLLYHSKQASSDGRLLVWKVSAMMVKEQPMGIGVGLFEHDYNLRQGKYFTSGESTELERYNSGTVYMAYNDFIEHTVEAGIPGLLFLLAFYIGTMNKAYRSHDTEALSIIVAFFVMSFTNFIYSSIHPWIVLIAYASIVISSSGKQMGQGNWTIINKLYFTAIAIGCMGLLGWHTPLLYSQIKLNQYQEVTQQDESTNLTQVESLARTIGTSEAYYRFMYGVYMDRGMYDKALSSIYEASNYTSTPDVFFSLFDCYDKMGKTEEGIPYIVKVTQMLPQNLTSRLVLLKWFDSQGAQKEAIRIATEIAQTPIKIHNQRSDDIIHYARTYLQKHQSKLLISK